MEDFENQNNNTEAKSSKFIYTITYNLEEFDPKAYIIKYCRYFDSPSPFDIIFIKFEDSPKEFQFYTLPEFHYSK